MPNPFRSDPKQIRFRFYRVAYDTPENFEKHKAEWLEVTRKKLPYLNNLLKNEYVTGKLSWVDILLYDFLLLIGAFEPKLLEENPNLARHVKTINSLPQISNYLAGKGKGECLDSTVSTFDSFVKSISKLKFD